MLRQKKRGQSALEYIVLIIVILGALIAMGTYLKRGIQGRWKTAVDELGEQYDPYFACAEIRHTLISQTNTQINPMNSDSGFFTTRTDRSISSDRKRGSSTIGVLPPQ